VIAVPEPSPRQHAIASEMEALLTQYGVEAVNFPEVFSKLTGIAVRYLIEDIDFHEAALGMHVDAIKDLRDHHLELAQTAGELGVLVEAFKQVKLEQETFRARVNGQLTELRAQLQLNSALDAHDRTKGR